MRAPVWRLAISTSNMPVTLDSYATYFPSGDSAGSSCSPGAATTGRRCPVRRSQSQTSAGRRRVALDVRQPAAVSRPRARRARERALEEHSRPVSRLDRDGVDGGHPGPVPRERDRPAVGRPDRLERRAFARDLRHGRPIQMPGPQVRLSAGEDRRREAAAARRDVAEVARRHRKVDRGASAVDARERAQGALRNVRDIEQRPARRRRELRRAGHAGHHRRNHADRRALRRVRGRVHADREQVALAQEQHVAVVRVASEGRRLRDDALDARGQRDRDDGRIIGRRPPTRREDGAIVEPVRPSIARAVRGGSRRPAARPTR